MPNNRLDLRGQRRGRLVAIRDMGVTKNRERLWLCQCDCGKLTHMSACTFNKGKILSCGCLCKEMCSENAKKYGGHNKMKKGEAAFRAVFKRYTRQAKEKRVDFKLTKEQFKELTQQDCYYCGGPPSCKQEPARCNGEYTYNGIDRVDNSKGYVLNNCVSCCSQCNKAKRDLTKESFYNWLQKVHKHLFGNGNGDRI